MTADRPPLALLSRDGREVDGAEPAAGRNVRSPSLTPGYPVGLFMVC